MDLEKATTVITPQLTVQQANPPLTVAAAVATAAEIEANSPPAVVAEVAGNSPQAAADEAKPAEAAAEANPPQPTETEANPPQPAEAAAAAEAKANPPQPAAAEAAAPVDAAIAVGNAAAVNESIVSIAPVDTVAAEVGNDFGSRFVSLGDEGLEQGIRNAVKSEVESEIEAELTSLVDKLHAEQEQKQAEIHIEPTGELFHNLNHKQILIQVHFVDAAQGVREPKTLATEHVDEENQKKDVPEKQELQPTIEERPLPSVTSDLVAVILDENRAITEQPITNTNLLALEQEHQQQLKVPATTVKPNYEEAPQHQVTKKQGVEDLLPIELNKEEQVEKKEEVESAPPTEVEVPAEPAPEPEAEAAPAAEVEAAPAAEEGSAPAVEAAAAAEPVVEPEGAEGTVIENASETASVVDEVKPVGQAQPTAAPEPEIVEAQQETDNQHKEDQLNGEPESDSNEIEENVIESDEKDKEQVLQPVAASVATTEKPVLSTSSESAEVSLTPTEASEVKSEVNQEESIDEEKTAAESSSTAAPAEPEVVKHDSSADESESSDESGETGTEQPVAVEVEKSESSEESPEEGDEEKERAEDSTATPLVSYPPHNAGRTFNSNLADESSAYHSLATNNRSTLIIALCSGTAVVFIIISLVIFLLSFQRQHGTLDIEMQEQRLGKDNLDEEDAQLKLLDVDLSTPVIIAMGNEETDECL